MAKDLSGLYSALLISFDENGNLNEKGIREIVRHNIDEMKVDGLYVGGSTGENFLISEDEKRKIFEIVKDEVGDEVKLIAQVGGNNIYESKRLAKLATELGYDSLSAVTPYYYLFSFDEIKYYYNDIMDGIDNTMIVYSIPALTKIDINLEQFGELFENEKVIGVKYTQSDFFLMERIHRKYPDALIFSGIDEMLLPALATGIDGAIGSTYNVNGLRARKLIDSFKAGDYEKARKYQNASNDLIAAILDNGLYPTIKELLKLEGADAGYSRRPMASADPKQCARAKEIYEEYLKGDME